MHAPVVQHELTEFCNRLSPTPKPVIPFVDRITSARAPWKLLIKTVVKAFLISECPIEVVIISDLDHLHRRLYEEFVPQMMWLPCAFSTIFDFQT